MIYTFKPENKQQAIELAAKMMLEGKEPTIRCSDRSISSRNGVGWIIERDLTTGDLVAHHYFASKLVDGRFVFAGITETRNFQGGN